MSYFAKIYPELMESLLLCENLGMELANVTSRNNNLMEEFIEDLNTIDNPIVYNSSVDSLSSVESIGSVDTALNFASSNASSNTLPLTGASLTGASLYTVASLRPDFMTPRPKNYYFKSCESFNRSDIYKKRTYIDAFGEDSMEDVRYGQHISAKFFVNNIGHNCTNSSDYENEFDAYYQANRNLFNV